MRLSLQDLGYNVFSVLECPKGWHAAIASQEGWHSAAVRGLPGAESAQGRQELLWEYLSGLQPTKSSFTLAIPMHNEEQGLSNLLGSLQFAVLPKSLPAQIVFVSNGCTDATARRMREILARTGKLDFSQIPPADQPLYVKSGSLTLIHIDCRVPSKAGALKVANDLALSAGHPVVMAMDADAWPEPETIARFYGDAHKHIVGPGAGTPAIISGRTEPAGTDDCRRGKANGWEKLSAPLRNLLVGVARSRKAHVSPGTVHGCLMAWGSDWFSKSGGFPPCCIEDYALGVRVRAEGGSIITSRAKIWTLVPDRILDRFNMTRRFVRGINQLGRLFEDRPVELEVMRADGKAPDSLRERLAEACRQSWRSPRSFPFIALRFIWREAARLSMPERAAERIGTETWERCPSGRPAAVADCLNTRE